MSHKKINLFLFCSVLSVAALAADNEEKGNDLLASWSFDEGEGTEANDKSGNGYDAVFMHGHEAKWVDGFIGKALEFGKDTKTCLEVKNSKNLNPENFTVEAWIKPRPDSTGQQEILCKSEDSPRSGGFRFRNNHSMVELRVSDGKQTFSCCAGGRGVLSKGSWIHVAGVFDGKTTKIFINGEMIKEEKNTKCKGSSLPIFIGAGAGGGYYYFEGIIDEVRLYSKAKTQDEIFADMDEQNKLHLTQLSEK